MINLKTTRSLVRHRQPASLRPGNLEESRRTFAGNRRGAQRRARDSGEVVFKPVLVTPDAVTELCQTANNAPKCIVSSPGAIRSRRRRCGSTASSSFASRRRICTRNITATFRGPLIDMNFIDMNQAAHGDSRSHGFILRCRAD